MFFPKPWSYNNKNVWRRLYDYLDKHNTPDHRFYRITFSTALDYKQTDKMPPGVYYPTIKLHFLAGPTEMIQTFW